MERDERPLDLLPDLAQLRAIYADFINRYDQTTEALLAWHQSWAVGLPEKFAAVEAARATGDVNRLRQALSELGDAVINAQQGRPRMVLDISDAYRILDAIGKMAKRIEDVNAQNAVSQKDFRRLMVEMARVCDRVINAHVPDPVTFHALRPRSGLAPLSKVRK